MSCENTPKLILRGAERASQQQGAGHITSDSTWVMLLTDHPMKAAFKIQTLHLSEVGKVLSPGFCTS